MRPHVTIGVTGGIGSGKSFVADILRTECGIPVYDCDSRAKWISDNDGSVRQQLIELAGESVYHGPKLVRSELARYVFSNTGNAHKVENVIHPAVKRDFVRWRMQESSDMVSVESAILYESGFDRLVDYVIFVDADVGTRIARAMARDGSDRQQVEARMAMQHVDEGLALASHVIYNVGKSREALSAELKQMINNIKNKYK